MDLHDPEARAHLFDAFLRAFTTITAFVDCLAIVSPVPPPALRCLLAPAPIPTPHHSGL